MVDHERVVHLGEKYDYREYMSQEKDKGNNSKNEKLKNVNGNITLQITNVAIYIFWLLVF